jgi:hypothetical protein
MSSRVIALVFTLVLCWSGPPTQQQTNGPLPTNLQQVDRALPSELPQADRDRSGDDEGLDALSALAQADGTMDLPTLVMSRPDVVAPALTMALPHPYAMAAWLAPYLAGPQRPPCEMRFIA